MSRIYGHKYRWRPKNCRSTYGPTYATFFQHIWANYIRASVCSSPLPKYFSSLTAMLKLNLNAELHCSKLIQNVVLWHFECTTPRWAVCLNFTSICCNKRQNIFIFLFCKQVFISKKKIFHVLWCHCDKVLFDSQKICFVSRLRRNKKNALLGYTIRNLIAARNTTSSRSQTKLKIVKISVSVFWKG